MPSFFSKSGSDGAPVLILTVDSNTGVITYTADANAVKSQRVKNTQKISQAVSELAARNPMSSFFAAEQ